MKHATLAVHAGDRKQLGEYVPATTPIYGATSYAYPRMEQLERVFEGEVPGQGYARYGSPTCAALEGPCRNNSRETALTNGDCLGRLRGVALVTLSGPRATLGQSLRHLN